MLSTDLPVAVTSPLLDLAHARLATLQAGDPDATLTAVMRRLFDPAKRDLVIVSAFQSSL